MSQGQRTLAAIMFTDVVGYTAMTHENESAALDRLEDHRRLMRPLFASHGGREVKTIGDAFLVKFGSALDATLCAVAVQSAMNDRRLATGDRLSIRIGIHVGDVIESQGDVLGDAVNIASRIEPLAEPGGVCVSEQVYDQVKNKVPYPMVKLPHRELKNVSEAIEVYRLVMPWEQGEKAQEAERYPPNRIAILPFASFSSDPEDAFFADGVTDEIISAAAGIGGLSVISRTSVIGYKGTTKKVREIGKELEVGSVLEGSFKKAGNRIRVTTQLIDVADDRHIWAQNYDRTLDDVFAVQSDVARQVAEALKVRILSPEMARLEKRPTESSEAYSLYMKGRFLWNKRGLVDIRGALKYFEQAVAEDQSFALGYAGQADCYVLLKNNFNIEPERNLELANKMVAKAVELDPDLAEARATKGLILNSQFRLVEAEREFKRAIELKPGYATAHQWYNQLLLTTRRWEEALREIGKALELDPLSPIIITNHTTCLTTLGRVEEALRELESAERLGVANLNMEDSRILLLLFLGRDAEAKECVDRALAAYGRDVGMLDLLGHCEYLKGNFAEARSAWEEAVEEGKKRSSDTKGFAADFALLYHTLGEEEKAARYAAEVRALPEATADDAVSKSTLEGYLCLGLLDKEGFFANLSKLTEANGAAFTSMRFMPTLFPRAREIFQDARWADTFRRAGLQPGPLPSKDAA